ncbi:MAG: hypothetical protein ABIV50_10740, partial [Opitutus sp.]
MTLHSLCQPIALTSLLLLCFALQMSAAEVIPPAPASAAAAGPANPNHLGTDANGNPLRRAPRTGHISNYDEAKVGHYTLPDPLVSASGERVTNSDTWFRARRPEILNLYQTEIYGRVPNQTPRVRFENVLSETISLSGAKALHRHAIVHIGDGANAVKVNVHTYLPPASGQPVPLLLHVTFGTNTVNSPTTPPTDGPPKRPSEAGPVADMLTRGFGYALVRYTEIQPDNPTTHSSGVQALSYLPGQTKPADNEWGTIAAWSWGLSRVLDFLATDSAVDAQRVALIGHSRLGKAVLWAGASDPRFALIFSSCAGEMGS